jgi:eukaryotic-like serine/threonine-protein kinase
MVDDMKSPERDAVETWVPPGVDKLVVIPGQTVPSVLARLDTSTVITDARESAGPSLATPVTDDAADAFAAADFAKYRVSHPVGEGAMGRVVAVQDRDLKRHVAMKILKRDGENERHAVRFIEEAQITGQLEHPNVLPVHDFGVNENGELYFTMKYVKEHENLAHVIALLKKGDVAAHTRYTFERRVQIIQQVCHALHYAHRRGVIHRDIKPANILLGNDGEVFLADWGVAKLAHRASEAEGHLIATSRLDTQATVDGTVIGSPAYMAPEQLDARQDDIDARSDVYALTAVLYELLTCKHYLGETMPRDFAGLVHMVREGKRRVAESYYDRVNGRVPRPLSRICAKGLALNPLERFQSARELELALQAWLEGTSPVVCPGTALQRVFCSSMRSIDRAPVAAPAVIIAAAASVAALAVFGLYSLWAIVLQ